MKKLLVVCLILLTVVSSIFAAGVTEETTEQFPTKPIKVVVGFAAGGGIDAMARTLAPALEEYLGVPVIIENMPGSSSGIAAEYVAKQEADGYTLFACSSSICVFSTSENSNITYNDLDMLVMPFSTHIPAVLVNAKSNIKNMDEYIAYVKNNKTTASTAGVGSTWHFPAIMLADAINASDGVSYVPYTSGKETTLAVARGEVDWSTCGIYLESFESISSGLVRPLAVLSSNPFNLKDYGVVPSVLDSIPELAKYIDIVGGWRGFAVKKGASEAVKAKLTDALNHAINSEAFKNLLHNNGLDVDSVIKGDAAQDMFEKSSRIFSYILYDLGNTPRDPMKVNVPRWVD